MIAFVATVTNCLAAADSDAYSLQNFSERIGLFFRLFRRSGCNSDWLRTGNTDVLFASLWIMNIVSITTNVAVVGGMKVSILYKQTLLRHSVDMLPRLHIDPAATRLSC